METPTPPNVATRRGFQCLAALLAAAVIAGCCGAAARVVPKAPVVGASSFQRAKAGDEWPSRRRRTPGLGKCLAVEATSESQDAASRVTPVASACLGTRSMVSEPGPWCAEGPLGGP